MIAKRIIILFKRIFMVIPMLIGIPIYWASINEGHDREKYGYTDFKTAISDCIQTWKLL